VVCSEGSDESQVTDFDSSTRQPASRASALNFTDLLQRFFGMGIAYPHCRREKHDAEDFCHRRPHPAA
jgi:hypothetical protein